MSKTAPPQAERGPPVGGPPGTPATAEQPDDAEAALAALWRVRLHAGAAVRVEPVRRFDSSFDAVTERCMAWPDFWCPPGP